MNEFPCEVNSDKVGKGGGEWKCLLCFNQKGSNFFKFKNWNGNHTQFRWKCHNVRR